MTLDEAIEILEVKQQEAEPHWERGDREAVALGIEALKREKERRLDYAWVIYYLPGEYINYQERQR